MNIIVFGGSGFLGSHVCDKLTDAGHNVTIFDKKKSQYLQSNQKMIIGDLLDIDLVNDVINGQDIVFNFAGIADIDECREKAIDTVKYNVLGNTILLEAARNANVQRFIFASSVYVYSNAGSFYRCSKQASESYVETFAQEFDLPYTILRFGSLYGERADDRNSIYRILKQALLEGVISYHGTGDEIREFIHVQDAASSCLEILKEEYRNQNIILTGSRSIKYKELLNMVKEMLNNQIEVKYLNKDSETHYSVSPYSFNPKLGKKLVNNPHIDMGQGILNCLAELHEKYILK